MSRTFFLIFFTAKPIESLIQPKWDALTNNINKYGSRNFLGERKTGIYQGREILEFIREDTNRPMELIDEPLAGMYQAFYL